MFKRQQSVFLSVNELKEEQKQDMRRLMKQRHVCTVTKTSVK